jgi:DNA polymerase-3 subunit epsilon
MRLVILDTETTGLKVEEGHRVIEIGAIELQNRRPTGRRMHVYLNPEREVDEGAAQVHGLTWDQLRDKPLFASVATEFEQFIAGADLIIHNAPFDVGFLNAELSRLGRPTVPEIAGAVTDTLRLARDLHPGQRNSLDALCSRYGVINEHRVLHGALLDAELLSEVFLAMTRGQETLDILADPQDGAVGAQVVFERSAASLLAATLPESERLAHEQMLDSLDKACTLGAVWRRGQVCSSG